MSSPWDMGRAQIGWWAIAGLLAAFLGYLFVSFIGTFVFGLFVYYATRPIYRRLRRVVKPPSLAAAISLVLIILPAILLLAYTIAIGLQELSRLIEVQGLEIDQLETVIEPYVDISGIVTDPVAILSEQLSFDAVWQNLGDAGAYVGFFGTAALHLFVIILLSFYLLRDDHRLADWFTERFTDADGVLETYAHRVDRDFSIIFFGNILNAFLTGIIGAIVYGALDFISPAGIGIPYSTLLGLLTGIASLVPVIGIKLVYFPLAGYLVYGTYQTPQLLWFPVLFVIVSFVIVDIIPDLVLRPYVSGRGLHLGMVMMAYVFGPLLFGWYGLFLGPMLLVLVVHFADLVLPELVEGREIRQRERDEPGGDAPDDGGDGGGVSAGDVVEHRSGTDAGTDDPSSERSDVS